MARIWMVLPHQITVCQSDLLQRRVVAHSQKMVIVLVGFLDVLFTELAHDKSKRPYLYWHVNWLSPHHLLALPEVR